MKRIAMRYKITRFYRENRPPEVVQRGLTSDEARAHCRDPESSSATCTLPGNLDHTREFGQWFDGYEVE